MAEENKGKRERIGIPYARQVVEGGNLYSVCPRCGSRIREDTDEFGEPTNNYGEHWLSEGHEDDA